MFNIKLSGPSVDKILALLGRDISDIADGIRSYSDDAAETERNENLLIAIKAQVSGN